MIHLNRLKEMIRESEGAKQIMKKIEQEALAGRPSVTFKHVNPTMESMLKQNGYTVNYVSELEEYVVSGW
jgi:sensor histidine kinase YesM